MRRFLFAMILCAETLSAHAYYFIRDVQAGYDLPSLDGSALRLGEVTVTEEPCTRPDASIVMEVWVVASKYSIDGLLQYGYKLAAVDLPKPGIRSDGACETKYVPASAPLTVQAPPTGNYNIAFFIRVVPSVGCVASSSDCYEDVSASPYINVQQRQAIPYRPDAIVPHVHPAWRETARAVEYFHAGLNHYFVTASSTEIDALDRGILSGWQRTGESFDVWTSGTGGRSRLCRFYGIVAGKGTHFYTAYEPECEGLMAHAPWQYESVLGYVELPGWKGCVLAPRPLYRLYNVGMGGSPNHRYTTSLDVRSAMVAQGWISEGYGDLGVIGCLP
jgi:hypothetical protein